MLYNRIRMIAYGVLLTLIGGVANPAWALPLDIAQSPLFLSTRVKPAFIMVIDDSGSMNWETLFPAKDGMGVWGRDNLASAFSFFANDGSFRQTGNVDFLQLFPYSGRSTDRQNIPATPNFGFARSPEFNPAYFDPSVFYEPWRAADGNAQFNPPTGNTSITAAPVDRLPLSGTTFNLTANRALTGNASSFDFRAGMVMPQGTRYHLNGNNCSGVGGANNAWVVAASDITVNATCTIAIDYFPATYFLTTNTSPDGNIAPLAVANQPNATPATLYRYEIKPANYSSAAQYAAAIQNFANWFSYYRTRHLAVRGGISIALTGVDFLRTGLFTINSLTNPVEMRDLALATDRGDLYSTATGGIFRNPQNGGTPNRQAVNHAGGQFQRSGANAPVQLACQANAAMLFTDGFSNNNGPTVGNVDGSMGVPFADNHADTMADIASRYYLANIRPDLEAGKMVVPSECSTANPDPRLDCRRDPHMNFYGVTLGSFGNVFGIDAAATADPFTNPPAWPSRQNDNRTTVDDIWHATVNTRGKMLNASTPQAITTAIRDVINAVLDSAQDSGTLALTGARVGASSFTVAPSFSVGNNGTDWSGRLTAFSVNADGGVGTQLWEAATQLPNSAAAATTRNVFVATVPGGTSKTVVPFAASNLGANATAQFAAMGITPTDIAVNFPTATPTQVVNYLRGDPSLELPTPGPFRKRTTRLGDIVGSTPEISSPKDDFGYGSTLSGALATSYQAYLASKASNVSMVFVGANDGMFHGFNGSNGREEFAFVPNAALKRIGALASRRYDHRYYVDGPVTVADTRLGGSWGTVVVGTGGAGTRTVFGVDITNPTTVGANDVLWEINDSIDADMGFALGKVQVLPVTGGQWVALVPNGYNSDSENAALFVIDINTGQILKKLVPNDGSTDANGLGNIVALDNDGDGFADTVYGGDLLGNVWKFDLSAASAASWNVAFGGQPLFTATDNNGDPQAITGGFDVTTGPGGNNMLLFGSGRFFVTGDNAVAITHQVQSFYAVLDSGSPIGNRATSLTRQAIISEQTVSVPNPNPPPPDITGIIRNITEQNVDFSTKNGWYIDLVVGSSTPKGERFIGNPRVQNGKVFFTTFEPQGDACTPGGKNFLYGLDAITGAASLNEVSIGDPNANPICANCGAINILDGAPVRDTILTVPAPATIAGLDCVPGDSGCTPPNPSDPATRCTLVLQTPGGRPIFLPRACGRQSWRQLE
jgi:type IV pilus assembly protein PilY1